MKLYACMIGFIGDILLQGVHVKLLADRFRSEFCVIYLGTEESVIDLLKEQDFISDVIWQNRKYSDLFDENKKIPRDSNWKEYFLKGLDIQENQLLPVFLL